MRLAAACALATAACAGHAAGGHHAVDDAAMLDEGRCELETWVTRVRGEGTVLHAGPGCRIGPVEVALAGERASGERSAAVQVKTAHAPGESLAVGALASAFRRRADGMNEEGGEILLVATWFAQDWMAHANAGRRWVRGDGGAAKGGVALEWSPRAGTSLVMERYVEQRTHFVRAGVRWQPTRDWTLDLSHARALQHAAPPQWTFGSTWEFKRP